MIVKVIERVRPNLTITTVSNGKDALEKVANNNYTAILTDLNMPIMDGFQLAEKIRDMNPDVPLALLTATASDAVIARATTMNIGCMAKPPEQDKLEQFLSEAGI